MSIRILKQGLLDTVQDAGRWGFQHWGINTGGAADKVAMSTANALVGNGEGEPVLELHWPAATILFEKDALVAISGAEFNASVSGRAIPLNTPVIVRHNSVLQFSRWHTGQRCNLALQGGFDIQPWLGSASTNIKASAGGYKGRKLLPGDIIHYKKEGDYSAIHLGNNCMPLKWKAAPAQANDAKGRLRICIGHEYAMITKEGKGLLASAVFTVTHQSDRMGNRLYGEALEIDMPESLISSGVTPGTVQLLPNGQLIILGVDCQTTGGYPRIAHIIEADMHMLAQLAPGETIQFEIVDVNGAETLLLKQHSFLQQQRTACKLRLEEFFTTHGTH